jgi:hypothetical protein
METDYKQKYLKYKKKYIDLSQYILTYSLNSDKSIDLSEQPYKKKYFNLRLNYLKQNNKLIGGALDDVEFTTIEPDTILFRISPNIRETNTFEGRLRNSRNCGDTGKTGLYFANKAIISLAMCIEYNRIENMELGIFRVIEPIYVSTDKYSFRQINPERYFNENGEFIRNITVLPEENISHIKCELNLLNSNQDNLLPEHIQDSINCLSSCEIFLSNQNDDLNKIEMIETFRFNPTLIRTANDLLEYMERNHYPFNIGKYIDDGILINF